MKGCFFSRLGYTGCELRPGGGFDPAHFVPQQRIKQVLKRRGYTAQDMARVVWDPRTYTLACREHHNLFDNKKIRLTEDQYPPAFRDWAAEYSFEFRGARDGWVGIHVEPGDAA